MGSNRSFDGNAAIHEDVWVRPPIYLGSVPNGFSFPP